jgi:hypothetical protein
MLARLFSSMSSTLSTAKVGKQYKGFRASAILAKSTMTGKAGFLSPLGLIALMECSEHLSVSPQFRPN